jgi:hypothetical protein
MLPGLSLNGSIVSEWMESYKHDRPQLATNGRFEIQRRWIEMMTVAAKPSKERDSGGSNE